MKKIVILIAAAVVAVGMIACKPSSEKTIANLKAAIDGEAMAVAKYAAFAERATAEGHPEVAALFQATSAAEQLHINNYQTVLTALGVVDYVAAIPEFKVDSTSANLMAAMDGEKYENEVMYPAFIQAAQDEKVDDAIVAFTYAKDAENGHAVIYATTLQSLTNGEQIAAAYFVCPKCGFVSVGQGVDVCGVCQTPGSEFTSFNAVMPLTIETPDGVEVIVPEV